VYTAGSQETELRSPLDVCILSNLTHAVSTDRHRGRPGTPSTGTQSCLLTTKRRKSSRLQRVKPALAVHLLSALEGRCSRKRKTTTTTRSTSAFYYSRVFIIGAAAVAQLLQLMSRSPDALIRSQEEEPRIALQPAALFHVDLIHEGDVP